MLNIGLLRRLGNCSVTLELKCGVKLFLIPKKKLFFATFLLLLKSCERERIYCVFLREQSRKNGCVIINRKIQFNQEKRHNS